jgi:hypothetical protein
MGGTGDVRLRGVNIVTVPSLIDREGPRARVERRSGVDRVAVSARRVDASPADHDDNRVLVVAGVEVVETAGDVSVGEVRHLELDRLSCYSTSAVARLVQENDGVKRPLWLLGDGTAAYSAVARGTCGVLRVYREGGCECAPDEIDGVG